MNFINALYEKAVSGISESTLEDCDVWYSYVINLPPKERAAYCITVLDDQVQNGGFHQYFLNPYGQFAYLTLDILEEVDANEVRNLLVKVLNEVNKENLSESKFRHEIYDRKLERVVDFEDELFDFLDGCDDEYYTLSEQLIKAFESNLGSS